MVVPLIIPLPFCGLAGVLSSGVSSLSPSPSLSETGALRSGAQGFRWGGRRVGVGDAERTAHNHVKNLYVGCFGSNLAAVQGIAEAPVL